LSEVGDALGGQDRVNSDLYLEAVIKPVGRCSSWPRSNDLRDALLGHDRASLKIQLETEIESTQMPWEAVIEQVWIYARRLRLGIVRDSL
jgi:hypothetical protein